jgi:hypothetical protein
MTTNTPKFARITEAQIAEALQNSAGLFSAAAQKLGVDASTVSRRVAKSEKLKAVVIEALDKRLDVAESELLLAIKRGEAWAICFFLKCKGKSRGYVERTEVTGGNGAPLGAAAAVPEDELDRIIADGEKGK